MSTLVLELSGPLQAWGNESRFVRRDTRMLPTKSGVVGLLAAALGRRRIDPIEDLAGLRFGVRQEQPGELVRDFQTAIDWRTGKAKPLSQRYYVGDAKFLAFIEGDSTLLEGLAGAIKSPVFPLYLGRRACPPGTRLVLGIRDGDIEDAIESEPWRASERYMRTQPRDAMLLYSRDAGPDDVSDEMVRDVPVSFDPRNREYAWRSVVHGWSRVTNPEGVPSDEHDVMQLLGGI